MKLLLISLFCCILIGIDAKKLRITNNEKAKLGEFPYLVSLQYKGQHVCGGSLISKKHVLTAAHCVHYFVSNKTDKSFIKVAVGTTTVPGGTLMEVDRISYHWDYKHSDVFPKFVADVGVITLKKEVTLSENVGIIGLPEKMQVIMGGTELEVSGFGATKLDGPLSPVLKKMKMFTLNREDCIRRWVPMPINSGLFCAELKPGFGICEGDSGGPLVLNKSIVIGTVSAVSIKGCGAGIPDVFTKVSHFIDYIKAEMSTTHY